MSSICETDGGLPLSRLTPVLAACIVLGVSATQPLRAQVVLQGRVLDDLTEEPVPSARVFLLNRYSKLVDYAQADEAGHFRFERRDHGRYRLEVKAVGYREAVSPMLWWTLDHEFTGVEVRLTRNVVLLAPLEIVALSPPTTSPVLENVMHRRARGFGIQVTREDIEERQPLHITDILVELPGVYAERRGRGASGRSVYMSRSLPGLGGGECPVQVFLDGMRATRDRPGGDVMLDDLVSPLDVEVIEVFRGLGSIPPEFLTPNARCGVIAIWTKRSLDMRP